MRLAPAAAMDYTHAARAIGDVLQTKGVHEALRMLNARTPYRYTGVYRYDGDMLRNECLFDLFDPAVTQGQDVPMVDAYCANVGRAGSGIEFADVGRTDTVTVKPGSPVVSYCGALIRDADGEPYGTLCHYDTKPCDITVSDMPLLDELAPLVYRALVNEGAPHEAGAIS